MAQPMRPAALGCRSHSGWAAIVALAGPLDSPQVIDRRRIVIADATIRGSKQPFHAAESMPFPAAEAFLKRCTDRTTNLAIEALRTAIADLRTRGYQITNFGITLGSGRPLPELKSVLASHALIHTAEGEFYRDGLSRAAKRCRLNVSGVKEKELFEQASARLRIPSAELERWISDLGKPLGPPWSQDQKYAAVAAWLAINGSGAVSFTRHDPKR